MSKPTVCLLSSAHPARDKRVFEKEAVALSAAGFSVIHVCPAAPGELEGDEVSDGVRIRRFRTSSGLLSRLLRVPRLIHLCMETGADVYHCNEVDSWMAGIVAAQRTGARVVFDVHEHYPSTFGAVHLPNLLHRPAAAAIRWLFRIFGSLTDGIVFAKASVAGDFDVPKPKTALVRNLPPLRLLDSIPSVVRQSRTHGVVAIHTGLTGRARGWPQLLSALEQLDAGLVQVLMIGAFNDGSSEQFWSEINRLGLEDRVRWESWMKFEDAFVRLGQADIGLILFQPGILNHTYASPHKLFEYMLAGLPVIAPRFALEVAEIVNTYECGLLIDPSDPNEIAAAMRKLADDPELRKEMGSRGRAAILDDLNWESEVKKLLALYSQFGLYGDGVEEVAR